MKKKFFGMLLFILTMAISLAACGNTNVKDEMTKSSGTTKHGNSSMAMTTGNSKNDSASTLSGHFMGENGKMVSGTATISNGKLMLSNFKTDQGPDLHVYLTKDGDIASGKSIAKIDLKAADQTFSLKGIDTSTYNTVVIYCNKAHVPFGQAMIMNPEMSMMGQFMGENGKTVSGTAAISNGKLMLSNFKTDQGPDLHVYVTKDGDIASGKSIAKIDLKATDQTFSLKGIDKSVYNTVVIYCNKAHVVFGSAKLM